MNMIRTAIIVPVVAIISASSLTPAEARTKTIVKYGAIGLGAAALYQAGQNSAYHNGYYGGYSQYPSYGYGYSQPYSGYYAQPGYASYPGYGQSQYYGGYYY